MGHVRIAVVVRCRGATECNNGVAAGRCDERAERFRHNVADIRSFHGTQCSENLGEHLALAKREPDIVLLYDVHVFL